MGLGTGPRYLGSDETATSPSAIFSVQYGPFFLDSMRGLGAEYSTPFGLHMTAALSYDPGRAEKNEGGNYWSMAVRSCRAWARSRGVPPSTWIFRRT